MLAGRISVEDLLSDAYYQKLSPSVKLSPSYTLEEYRLECSVDPGQQAHLAMLEILGR